MEGHLDVKRRYAGAGQVHSNVVAPQGAAKSPSHGQVETGRFRGFDGLRGIAILMVIVYHGIIASLFPIPALGPLRPLFLAGWTGVDLFFALSGFLITSLLLREEHRALLAGRPAHFSIGRFYLRRVFRIMPAFYAVLLLDVFIFSRLHLFASANVDPIRASPLGLLPYGAFWTNYHVVYGSRWWGSAMHRPRGAFEVFWSLCVEEHFYLLWPLFLLLVKSTRTRVFVAIGLGLALAGLRHAAISLHWETPLAVHYASHYRLDSILWGATAAILAGRVPWSSRLRRCLLLLGLTLILALVMTDTMSVLPVGKPLGFSLGYSLLALTTSVVLLELVDKPGTWLTSLLEFRPLAAVGKVSFGMYLLHFPMIDLGLAVLARSAMRPTLLNLGSAIVLFASLSFVAAWILYQLVEKRFLAIKDRYFG
jgi:peptidoglycan/LPS O-acetylase OafA/YrhL